MDPSVLGTVDDSFDPTIFSFIDLANTAGSSGDQVDFNWVDDFITSTETPSDIEGPAASQEASSAPISIQQPPPVQQQQPQQPPPPPPPQQQQQQQKQLLHNVLQQKQQQPPAAPPVGKVIMAMGQTSQQQTLAVAASTDSSTATPQLLAANQSSLLHSNVGSQAMAPPFILKASTPIQLVGSSVSQSTAAMGGTPQQFVPAASGLSSISASQRSSPLLSRSLTPNLTPTTTHTTSHLSSINLLQVQQSPQLTQTLPLSNFVANQQNLQGHAVLTAQGSNIVHTQNALIQNPNVVNVNVAHVLSNQLPQLQVLQTPQGKIYVQSPASNQALPQQLCLSQVAGTQPVQMAGNQTVQMAAGSQAVQMAAGSQAVQVAGQPVHLAGAQTMQVASNVGLAPPTAVIAQPQSNVALGSSSGVGQQQASYNFFNFGGSQGQILVQRMPSSAATVTQSQPLPQGQIFLRTVNGQQQLIQQPTLQSAPSTTQLPQQLVAQTAGTTHNIPLQQFLRGVGAPSLRLVGPATAVSTPQASSLSTTTTSTTPSIVLQPLVTAPQVPLLGQQVTTQAGSNSGTVTLNLTGQNLNLHPLQNLSALQLNTSQSQPIIVQQQQQQQQHQQHLTIQQTVVRAPSPKVSAGSSSKKSKSKSTATSSSASTSASSSVPALSADNILSAALMSSGILDDEDFQNLMNGSDMTDASLVQAEVTVTPSPSSVRTTPTPTPPPPTPPAAAKKSKKKKKEACGGVVQHVVLSSTAMRSSVTITTASATTVTTTVSQSVLSGHTLSTSTHSLASTPLVSLSANSGVLSAVSQTTTTPSVPTVSMASTPSLPSTSATSSLGGRGKAAPPSVMGAVQGLSAEDRQEFLTIQASLNKLREQASQDQNSLALMQQLDMRRRKILAANSSLFKHQQQQQQQQQQQMQEKQPEPGMASGAMQIRLQGPVITTSAPANTSTQPDPPIVPTEGTQVSLQVKGAQAIVPVQSTTLGQSAGAQAQPPFQLTSPSAGLDVKPLMGTPSAPVLTIQPKSNSKLALLSPKPDPAAPSCAQMGATKAAVDVKPVLGVGGVEIPSTSAGAAQGSTFTTPTGNVIMAMTNPSATGPATSSQPKMLRIQIGSHNAQAVAFPKATTTTAITTSAHHVVLPSPHKMGISSNSTVTTVTSVTATPAVSRGPSISVTLNQARPVQIKIANQLLTLQLTQQQQEKLELHLSRMTLEQQQAFLRQQQHILAKLQHQVDLQHNSSQAAPPQKSLAVSGEPPSTSSTPAASAVPVSAAGDAVPQVPQPPQVISTTSAFTTTTTQQLPVTVQALVGTPPKTEGGPGAAAAPSSSIKNSGLRGVNLEIPKSTMIHSQLSRDQEHAVTPDTRSPFKDHREACRRLLRYHVHQSHEPTLEQMDEFDRHFEKVSEDLMGKKESMMAKFQLLLLKDSMRTYPTSEQVLLSRMWSSEMQILQREERELVNTNPDAFVPMPMSYLEKDLSKNEEEDSEEEEEVESPPPSEEEEEEEEMESKGGESEVESEHLADDCPVEETVGGKTETEQCEPSPPNYFDSSPYPPYPVEDPVSTRPEAQEEDSVWDPHGEDRSAVWEECRDEEEEEEYKDQHARDLSSEADQFHSSFNDSFEASTPVDQDRSHTHTSPPRESSSAAEEQSSFQSESSRSSPPRPDPPARTLVKLVIRNDGSGFTSKLLEKRRSSDAGERRSLRSRSHSGHERGEGKKIKKEPVTEEVEYIDVDNSKYSKGVSVKLERLSERTSQEYGLNIASRASSVVRAGETQKPSADPTTSTVTSASVCGPLNMVSKSGRKRRGLDLEADMSVNSKGVKRESDYSGLTSSGCDGQREVVFREVKEERGFYVGSAMESLDHFDSEDDEDRGGPFGDDMRGRIGQSVIDVRGDVHAHKAHSNLPVMSSSSYRPSALNSMSSLVKEEHEDMGLARAMNTQETEHPVFAQPLSSGFLRSHRLAESSPSHAMETSFDLDNADPQRSMVNPQVQSAIDSILNGSSSGDAYGSTAAVPGIVCVEDSEDEACRSSPPVSDNGPLTSSPTHRWRQEQSPHDLDAAVRSILR